MSNNSNGNGGCFIMILVILYFGYNYISDYFEEKSVLEKNRIKYQALIKKNNEQEYIDFLMERDGLYSEKVDNLLWSNTLKNKTFKNYIDIQEVLGDNYRLKNIGIAIDCLDNIYWKEAVNII